MAMLTLGNLKRASGSKTDKRRVGRGNASGKGNYSGRGGKGQRARSGGKNKLALKGIRGYLLRIPKNRGFKSSKPRMAIVNLGQINEVAKANDLITPVYLLNKGLVAEIGKGVKILGQGKLTKKLTIKAHKFSQTAKEAIIKSGSKLEIITTGKKIK
jgi:large subunit ribosomal protein L15